jgi:hypothetical protein
MADSPDIATPVAPQPVYSPPPRQRPVARPAAAAPARRSGGSRFLRFLGVLLLIGILAAIIATVVLLVTDAGQDTNIGELISNELGDQISKLEDFIRSNLQ